MKTCGADADADAVDGGDVGRRESGFHSQPESAGAPSTSAAGLLWRAEAGGSIQRFWLSKACSSSVQRGL